MTPNEIAAELSRAGVVAGIFLTVYGIEKAITIYLKIRDMLRPKEQPPRPADLAERSEGYANYLAHKVADLDRHIKEHTSNVAQLVNSSERMADTLDRHTDREEDSLREIRLSLNNLNDKLTHLEAKNR